MSTTISYYFVHWNTQNNRGFVDLYDSQDQQIGQLPATSPEQLSAFHILLSDNNETGYDTRTGELVVGQAAVGVGVKTRMQGGGGGS